MGLGDIWGFADPENRQQAVDKAGSGDYVGAIDELEGATEAVDAGVDTLFENPGELPGVGQEDSIDLPGGSPRDPFNTDPGAPGPQGGADEQNPTVGALQQLVKILPWLVAVYALGQLLTLNFNVGDSDA